MNHIFCLDFETTGLNVFHHDIIEVGCKKLTENQSYHTLVIPKENDMVNPTYQYVSPRINDITGITDTMIIDSGILPMQMIEGLFNYINQFVNSNDTVYLVSHNGNGFDFIFLRRYIHEYNNNIDEDNNKINIDNYRFIDSMFVAKLIHIDGRVNQPYLCRMYNIENISEHRAIGDVNALEQLYIKLCEVYSLKKGRANNYYIENPAELLRELYY